MTLDQVVTALIYLASVFVLFFLSKMVFDKLNPGIKLKQELIKKDNFAVALTITGYYLALVFAVGGILEGPAQYWLDDVFDILIYGILATILLNLSTFVNDKLILNRFDITNELLDDQNAGTGIVMAGNYIAIGLIVNGAVSGEGGGIATAVAFWLLGQAALVVASKLYNIITPFDVHTEIEKDNVAVGVAFAGMLVGLGNIIRLAIFGDFISWQINLSQFGWFTLFGILLLPILRFLSDKILLPGERLTDELVNQEKPNVGAGTIEAFSYIAASLLLGWVV